VLGLGHGERLLRWEAEHGPIVTAQQDRGPDGWGDDLRDVVGSVTVDDFVLGDPEHDCLDLFAVVRV
jgi:hypothetical protein